MNSPNQTQGYYVECGAALTPERNNTKYPFTRGHYMHPNETHLFSQKYMNVDVYQTNIVYINPYWRVNQRGKWIIDAQQSLKWSDFYLDFDKIINNEEDHEMLKEDIEVAIRYLTLIFKIPERYVQIYFSGNKGYHLIIAANTVGLEPHIKLNQIFKEIAENINKYIKNDTLDLGIYDDKRLFRIPNSINDKGGLYKIPLTVDEFRKMKINDVRRLAMQPRVIDFPKDPVSSRAPEVFKGVIEEWTKKAESQKEFSNKMLNIKEAPPCIKEMHNREFKETIDERNNSGTALASYYFQRNLPADQTFEILMEWGTNNCTPALDKSDIETIVDSVYNGGYRYGCGTFSRLSGVCKKDICPLFRKDQSTCVTDQDIENVEKKIKNKGE